jgi:hypothetical protein
MHIRVEQQPKRPGMSFRFNSTAKGAKCQSSAGTDYGAKKLPTRDGHDPNAIMTCGPFICIVFRLTLVKPFFVSVAVQGAGVPLKH